jgi:hypothetical protein
MPRYLKIGIAVAVVGGFIGGFVGPNHRFLKRIGFATACSSDGGCQ